MPTLKKNGSITDSWKFDNTSGNFIVTIYMTPEEYANLAQQQNLSDTNWEFNKNTGVFQMVVSMTPEEYGKYAQDKVIPLR